MPSQSSEKLAHSVSKNKLCIIISSASQFSICNPIAPIPVHTGIFCVKKLQAFKKKTYVVIYSHTASTQDLNIELVLK